MRHMIPIAPGKVFIVATQVRDTEKKSPFTGYVWNMRHVRLRPSSLDPPETTGYSFHHMGRREGRRESSRKEGSMDRGLRHRLHPDTEVR